ISGHFGMGYSDRTSAENLLSEDRDHRSGRSDHVSESHRDISCGVLPIEILYHQLGHTLCSAHYRRRPDRFVGGHHHEYFHSVISSELADHSGCENVILHLFARISFHHRNVLVGCGVKHDVRAMDCEYHFHTIPVADVGYQWDFGQAVEILIEFTVDV